MKTQSLQAYLKVIDTQCSNVSIHGAALDSRLVKPNEIFFACKGDIVDGNLFAQAALDAGAAVAVMDDKALYEKVNGNKVLVEDTIASILTMGRRRLRDIKAIKIGVTGSFGKTSTKEMLRLLLSDKFKTQLTEGNYNNMLGLSLTACGISDDTEVVVFEMGTNAIGEISALSRLVKPDIAVLTGFGYAHIGKFQGLAQVVHEKLSIVDNLAENGRGLVIAHEKFARGLTLKDKAIVKEVRTFGTNPESTIWLDKLSYKGRQLDFVMHTNGQAYPCSINYPYSHLAENFLAAFAVGQELGIAAEELTAKIRDYETLAGRGGIVELHGLSILDDSYNASLETIVRAINNLSMFDIEPKYALIGEVMEIDGYEDEVYGGILAKAAEHPEINFIFSGEAYTQYSNTEAFTVVSTEKDTKAALDKVKGGVMLVKASHGCHFERYIEYMRGGRHAL